MKLSLIILNLVSEHGMISEIFDHPLRSKVGCKVVEKKVTLLTGFNTWQLITYPKGEYSLIKDCISRSMEVTCILRFSLTEQSLVLHMVRLMMPRYSAKILVTKKYPFTASYCYSSVWWLQNQNPCRSQMERAPFFRIERIHNIKDHGKFLADLLTRTTIVINYLKLYNFPRSIFFPPPDANRQYWFIHQIFTHLNHGLILRDHGIQ